MNFLWHSNLFERLQTDHPSNFETMDMAGGHLVTFAFSKRKQAGLVLNNFIFGKLITKQ